MSESVEVVDTGSSAPDLPDDPASEPQGPAELAARFVLGEVVTMPSFAEADGPPEAVALDAPDGATVDEVFEEVGGAAEGSPSAPTYSAEGALPAPQEQVRERMPEASDDEGDVTLDSHRISRSGDEEAFELPPHGREGVDGDSFGEAEAVAGGASLPGRFFAGLWGMVRGLGGTMRRSEDRESAGRPGRR